MAAGPCELCSHSFDEHRVVSLFEPDGIPAGGVILCPDCDCTATWARQGQPRPAMPSDEMLANIRSHVFRK